RVPHEGNFGAVLVKISTQSTQPVRSVRADVSPALEKVVMQALSKAPEDRFASVAALSNALRAAAKPGIAAPVSTSGLPAAPAPAVQRRRYERQAYVTLVRIIQEDGLILDGRSEDISEGGMLVLTERACTNGMKATIRFALPLSGKIASVAATLRWVRSGRGRVAAGLQFEGLEAQAQEEIGRYVTLMAKTAG
ncbi:MAG: PilZ domain-containing protein, partial [Myxococcota bacterium]